MKKKKKPFFIARETVMFIISGYFSSFMLNIGRFLVRANKCVLCILNTVLISQNSL